MSPAVTLTIWDDMGNGLHEIVDWHPPADNASPVLANQEPEAITQRIISIGQLLANIQQSINLDGPSNANANGIPFAIIDEDGTTRYERVELGRWGSYAEFAERTRRLCGEKAWRVMVYTTKPGERGMVVVNPEGVSEETWRWADFRGRVRSVFAVRDVENNVPLLIVGDNGGVVYAGRTGVLDWDHFGDFAIHVRTVLSQLGQTDVRIIAEDVRRPVEGLSEYLASPEGQLGIGNQRWLRFRRVFRLVCAQPPH